jgi:hypothetical protein
MGDIGGRLDIEEETLDMDEVVKAHETMVKKEDVAQSVAMVK